MTDYASYVYYFRNRTIISRIIIKALCENLFSVPNWGNHTIYTSLWEDKADITFATGNESSVILPHCYIDSYVIGIWRKEHKRYLKSLKHYKHSNYMLRIDAQRLIRGSINERRNNS